MELSFYDMSVASFQQHLTALDAILDKGEAHAATSGVDIDDWIRLKLTEDMLPMSFQLISAWHHSLGAIRGYHAGEFAPPPKMSNMTWAKSRALITEAREALASESREGIDALVGKPMVFKLGERALPFTVEQFCAGFSLPNFYFHVTTAYDLLRMQGVQLGKMDYIGQMRLAT